MCLHTSFSLIWTARIPFVQNWWRALAKALSHRWEGVQRKRLIITKTFRARSKNVQASLVEIVCVWICWHHFKCCRVSFSYLFQEKMYWATVQLQQQHNTGWWQTEQWWASKTNTHITTCGLFSPQFRPERAAAPQSPSRDRAMSASDRMERKLEKDSEITRCLWKTPLCYVSPSSH